MTDWRSIDESGPRLIVLKGIPARTPRAWRAPERVLTLGGLVLLLQRIIAWSVAGAAHLLVAALILVLAHEATRTDGDTLVYARLWRPSGGETGKSPEPEPPAAQPVVEVPKAAPAPESPSPEPETGFLPATPVEVNPAAPAAVPELKPSVIGSGASAAGAPAAAPAPAPAVSESDIDRDPTAALKKRRADDLDKLRAGSAREIVVVSGAYDDVEEVLERLGIRYTRCEPEQLARKDLSACKVLLINCHTGYQAGLFRLGESKDAVREVKQLEELAELLEERIRQTKDKKKVFEYGLEHLKVTSRLSALRSQLEMLSGAREMVENVRRFAESGGYVFTSDWGLTLIEKAFPGYLRGGGHVGPLTTSIRPKSGRERHPLMEEVFWDKGPAGSTVSQKKVLWEVDSGSYFIRIDKPAAVEVLVEGAALSRYPSVAVTFTLPLVSGRAGRILHVLSHFKKQVSKSGDYALQNLLLNFLVERFEP